jgi:hypothetical protein
LNGSSHFTFYNLLQNAGFYWLASVIGITMIYFICKEEQLLMLIFSRFLAAITFPHAADNENVSR